MVGYGGSGEGRGGVEHLGEQLREAFPELIGYFAEVIEESAFKLDVGRVVLLHRLLEIEEGRCDGERGAFVPKRGVVEDRQGIEERLEGVVGMVGPGGEEGVHVLDFFHFPPVL